MGKKDNTRAAPRIDQYRAALGRQEFKGRNKKVTQAMKEKSQIKESTQGEALSSVLNIVAILVATLLGLYVLVWYALQDST
eukprot:m.217529 g.217529  ORF g.217529 m.217529 type:complete len:81 (-) comp15560_c0_seq4:8360-8602(-)